MKSDKLANWFEAEHHIVVKITGNQWIDGHLQQLSAIYNDNQLKAKLGRYITRYQRGDINNPVGYLGVYLRSLIADSEYKNDADNLDNLGIDVLEPSAWLKYGELSANVLVRLVDEHCKARFSRAVIDNSYRDAYRQWIYKAIDKHGYDHVIKSIITLLDGLTNTKIKSRVYDGLKGLL